MAKIDGTHGYAFRCPDCGDVDEIDVEMSVWGRIRQDKDGEFETDTDAAHCGDHEYTDNSAAQCGNCGHRALLEEFNTDNQCDTCGDFYRDGGDGYDGKCPSCADEAEESEAAQ